MHNQIVHPSFFYHTIIIIMPFSHSSLCISCIKQVISTQHSKTPALSNDTVKSRSLDPNDHIKTQKKKKKKKYIYIYISHKPYLSPSRIPTPHSHLDIS